MPCSNTPSAPSSFPRSRGSRAFCRAASFAARSSADSVSSYTSEETCIATLTRTVGTGAAPSTTACFRAPSGHSHHASTTGSTARNRAAAP